MKMNRAHPTLHIRGIKVGTIPFARISREHNVYSFNTAEAGPERISADYSSGLNRYGRKFKDGVYHGNLPEGSVYPLIIFIL